MKTIRINGHDISRRSLLRGLLGGVAVAVALPPLELFWNGNGTAYASGLGFPKRFGLFFWGNGMRPDQWIPTGEGTEWELSEELAALVNVKHRISVVSGMAVKLPNSYPHTSGVAGVLTGADLLVDGTETTYALPTIDQIIAQGIGGDTLFRSIQTTATGASGLSYNGPQSRNPPESSPIALFERIFGSTFHLPGEEVVVDPSLGLRQSVLDAVLQDTNALKSRVGAADKLRLDQHMEGIREIERRLAKLQEDPPSFDACGLPPQPLSEYPDIEGRPQVREVSRAMIDLLAMAMACDQTRVFGHYFSDPVSNVLYEGASGGHHTLTHDESGDQPEVHAITTLIMEEMAYMYEKLESIPEGDTTLLDNSVVVSCSEVGTANVHDIADIPIVIGGSGQGKLKTGIHYHSYTEENVSSVMLSVVRAVDVLASSFGEGESQATESLSAIEV